MLASLSTSHVTTTNDFTSLELGFLLCKMEAAMGQVREPSPPEPFAQKHSRQWLGFLSVTSTLFPGAASTLHLEIRPLAVPRPYSQICGSKTIVTVFICLLLFIY